MKKYQNLLNFNFTVYKIKKYNTLYNELCGIFLLQYFVLMKMLNADPFELWFSVFSLLFLFKIRKIIKKLLGHFSSVYERNDEVYTVTSWFNPGEQTPTTHTENGFHNEYRQLAGHIRVFHWQSGEPPPTTSLPFGAHASLTKANRNYRWVW